MSLVSSLLVSGQFIININTFTIIMITIISMFTKSNAVGSLNKIASWIAGGSRSNNHQLHIQL